MTGLRLAAFGDLGPAPWGVSWISNGSDSAEVAVRLGSTAEVLPGSFVDEGRGGTWRFEGERLSMVFTPGAEPVHSHDAEDHFRRQDQLCEVTGHVRLDGQDAEVSCKGWRSSTEGDAGLNDFDSLRFLAAWLGERDGFSLLALRPRKARGQESDIVAAAVLEDFPPRRVVDPRLSTTYTDDGRPARAGLELWLEEDDPDAGDGAGPPQYPRRAAGEVTGVALGWSQGDLDLHASLFRWHSHGHEGPGIYILGRRR